MLCRLLLTGIIVTHKKENNKCQQCNLNNYFQCAPKHLLTPFFFKEKNPLKVSLSVLGAAKTESGYNTHCKLLCSAMIDACAK